MDDDDDEDEEKKKEREEEEAANPTFSSLEDEINHNHLDFFVWVWCVVVWDDI